MKYERHYNRYPHTPHVAWKWSISRSSHPFCVCLPQFKRPCHPPCVSLPALHPYKNTLSRLGGMSVPSFLLMRVAAVSCFQCWMGLAVGTGDNHSFLLLMDIRILEGVSFCPLGVACTHLLASVCHRSPEHMARRGAAESGGV